jgi:hypothetical protein
MSPELLHILVLESAHSASSWTTLLRARRRQLWLVLGVGRLAKIGQNSRR